MTTRGFPGTGIRALLGAGLTLSVLVLGCGGGGSEGWSSVAEPELTPAQVAMKARAEAAREAMFTRLMGELTGAMNAGGPAEAIGVCAKAAPEIAEEVAEDHGLAIGRTSFRLRNPENLPPAWAEQAVRKRVEEEAFFAGPAGELGVLTPIRVRPPCVQCHGPAESIAPEVAEVLAAEYPGDEATGFAAGDLRGWFWVEVGADSLQVD